MSSANLICIICRKIVKYTEYTDHSLRNKKCIQILETIFSSEDLKSVTDLSLTETKQTFTCGKCQNVIIQIKVVYEQFKEFEDKLNSLKNKISPYFKSKNKPEEETANYLLIGDEHFEDGFETSEYYNEENYNENKNNNDIIVIDVIHKCTENNCEDEFADLEALENHLKLKHIYKCKKCPEIYHQKSKYNNHLKVHQQSKNKSKADKNKTEKNASTSEKKCPYENCSSSNISYPSINKLKYHIRVHHTLEKPFVCESCGQAFKSRYELNKHNLGIHKKVLVQCELCGKLINQIRLSIHKTESHGAKQFLCPVCGIGKTTKQALKSHLRCHDSNKQKYECQDCGKSYNYPHYLKVHQRVHSGIRPYVCEICNKTFIDSYKLKVHKTLHSNIKPYKCQICTHKEYAFTHSMYLHFHNLNFHKKKKVE